jgi:hypothetical protein
MQERKKTLILIILFFLFYFCFGLISYLNFGVPNNTSDFQFHWNKLQGIEPQAYAPLFYVLMLPFSWNAFVFWLINIIFIICVFPWLFYKISGSWWGALIYFCGISLAHQQVYAATFPSAIVLILFLVYWKMRPSPTLWAIFFVTSLFLHSFGAYLFLLVGIIELIGLFLKDFNGKEYWLAGQTVFPGTFLVIQKLDNFRNLIGLFISQIPLPIAIIGFFNLKDWKEWFLTIVSFLAAIIDFRAIAIAQIFLGISFARRIQKASLKFKIMIFVFLILQLCFYLLDFAAGTWNHLT